MVRADDFRIARSLASLSRLPALHSIPSGAPTSANMDHGDRVVMLAYRAGRHRQVALGVCVCVCAPLARQRIFSGSRVFRLLPQRPRPRRARYFHARHLATAPPPPLPPSLPALLGPARLSRSRRLPSTAHYSLLLHAPLHDIFLYFSPAPPSPIVLAPTNLLRHHDHTSSPSSDA